MTTVANSSILLEFGSYELDPIISVFTQLLEVEHLQVKALRATERSTLDYTESTLSLRQAKEAMASGEILSILLDFPEEISNKHGMVFTPHFLGDPAEWWHGQIEKIATKELSFVQQQVRQIKGIFFASLSIEDGLDFDEFTLEDLEKFPWEDWKLITAIVDETANLSHAEWQTGPAAHRVLSSAT